MTISDPEIAELIDRVSDRDGWETSVKKTGGVEFGYLAVPRSKLERRTTPGIDVDYIGNMWMLVSYDSIGHGLGIEHQGILNHGKTVDCQHLDDAVDAVEHGMERIEIAVGEELRDAYSPRMLTDGGNLYSIRCPYCGSVNNARALAHEGVCVECRKEVEFDPSDPEVVCLCGSTKFKDAYVAEKERLTMAGKIVISVGLFGHEDGWDFLDTEKAMLDEIHKRKIDMADRVHVINVDGYIGDSTDSEIAYAKHHGIDVTYLNP